MKTWLSTSISVFVFICNLLGDVMKISKGQAPQYDDQNVWGRKFDLKECERVDSQEKPIDRIKKSVF